LIVSLALLVKSADWLVESAEKIGLALKLSPFIIGVTIVSIGTSFPEVVSSVVAVLKGASELAVANAVGSNIANILLIVGISAIAAKTLVIKRSLIDLDAPLLSVITVIFIFIVWNGEVVFGEGIILLIAFIVYFLYTLFHRKEESATPEVKEIIPEKDQFDILPSRVERRREEMKKTKMGFNVFFFLILGIVGLAIGANYTVESVIEISDFFNISSALIAVTAVALGTSLPELMVSVKAALNKKYEIAIGNVFGSNIFNILIVVGIPSLIRPLPVEESILYIGIPFLALSTLLFVVSGISRRIHVWEGVLYLLLYVLFVIKLFGFF